MSLIVIDKRHAQGGGWGVAGKGAQGQAARELVWSTGGAQESQAGGPIVQGQPGLARPYPEKIRKKI
jgi:hypothetical protein